LNDVRSWIYNHTEPIVFVEISQVLEGLIAGAMLEALPYFHNKTLLPYIGNLIATESRHAAVSPKVLVTG
jgi:hypothetical protein